MTQWMFGEGKITTKLAGPRGGRVRVGDFILPVHIFVDFPGNDAHPDLHMHLEWRDGRPQVVEISITAKPEGRGVRKSDLEVLVPDGIAASVFEGAAMRVVDDRPDGVTLFRPTDWSDPGVELEFWQLDKALHDAIATRRGGKSRADLERVAETYTRHKGRGALVAVAATLGVSKRTAARRVNDARAAGLLPANDRKASR